MLAEARRYLRLGQDEQARRLCRQGPANPEAAALLAVLEQTPAEDATTCTQRGRLGLSLGRPDLAESYLHRALALDDRPAATHGLLGTLYRVLGDAAAARRCYQAALERDPDEVQACVGLAVLDWQRGNLPVALADLRRRLQAQPDCVPAALALADILSETGDYGAAILLYEQVLDKHPDFINCRQGLVRCLTHRPDAVLSLRDLRHLEESFEVADIEIENLAQATVVVLLQRPAMQPLWSLNTPQEACQALATGHLQGVLSDTLLRRVLPHTIMADVRIERGLTGLRHALLKALAGPVEPGPEVQEMAASLALQCWLNEFVWAVSAQEIDLLSSLQGRSDQAALLGLAMYQRLTEPIGPNLGPLLHWHREVPEQEQALAQSIPSLTPTTTGTSADVSRQYEENPYPRWRTLLRSNPLPPSRFLELLLPGFSAPEFLHQPDVLVAGCGTGRDLLSLAASWHGARFTGIDLSRASLAHASRMAQQLQLEKVALYQADLLSLGEWDRHFDLILCTGVLHHLSDPLAGWRVLLGLLRPGGVMKVALYSALGRTSFVAGQKLARAHNMQPDPEGIRATRRLIMELPAEDPAFGCMHTRDFYYLSGCRDLLLHVQEHCFSLPRLQQCLQELGLQLLGFEVAGATRARFDALFPEPSARTNLFFWEKYEELYPETFRGMYQFWVKKA